MIGVGVGFVVGSVIVIDLVIGVVVWIGMVNVVKMFRMLSSLIFNRVLWVVLVEMVFVGMLGVF